MTVKEILSAQKCCFAAGNTLAPAVRKQYLKNLLLEVRKREKEEKLFQQKYTRKKATSLADRVSKLPKSKRLNFLIKEASRSLKFTAQYNKLRIKKHPVRGKNCVVCGEKADCMHHILPLSCGGRNNKGNLIPVCNRCHIKIHPFMK